jgi:predicted lipase
VPQTHTQAFAAYNASTNHVVVAFRGTQSDSAKDWVTDARFITTSLHAEQKVHSGFLQAWLSVAPMLRHWLATPLTQGATVTVCGHSLGAALATIAALELPCDSLVTLGSPRVGNQAFANRVLSSVREVLRLVNCCDVVTMVPPPIALTGGYAHVGEAAYIDRHGMMVQGVVNDIAQEADRNRARGEWLLGQPAALPGKGRVMLRELADHAPINYLRALF